MPVNIYLNFNGNCKEAMKYYAEAFQTEAPQIMTFGEAPPNPDYPLPEEAKELVMHGRITVDGTEMMFSDTFPGAPYEQGNAISLAVVSQNEQFIRTAFDKLQDGGKVNMELQETFWSKCYGQVIDRFGVEWQLSLEE